MATTSDDLLKYILGTGLQVGGSLISGQQQAQTADKDRGVRQAQLLQNEDQFNQNDDLARQKAGQFAQTMDPLAQQKSRQQQALLAAIVGNAQNAGHTVPGGPRTGGVMNLVPQGGFSPETLGFFSKDARAAAEGDFAKANAPFSDPASLGKVGYGAAGADQQASAQQIRDAVVNETDEKRKAAHQALMQSLMQEGEDPDEPGFWHKFAAIAAPIAGIALAPFTGGGSLGLMALGGATGAIGAWGAGGNPLTGGALGAAGGYASAKTNSQTPPFAGVQGNKPQVMPVPGNISGGMGPSGSMAGGMPLGSLQNQGVPSYLQNPNFGSSLPGPMNPAPSPYGTPPAFQRKAL